MLGSLCLSTLEIGIVRYMKLKLLVFAAVFSLSTCAFADALAWDVTGQNQFGKLNLQTGNFNALSSVGFIVAGLGEIGTTVYTAQSGSTGLFAVNTNTGALSLVGDASLTYYTFGSTQTGLYMVDTVGGLWNIDPSTGSSTLIGSTHLNIVSGMTIGLSAGSNNLYLALGSSVYTINTSTGLASYIGDTGTTDFGALVDVSGVVYGTSIVDPNSIYSFNPSTGAATFLTTSAAGDYSFGVAPIVPEPGSLTLLGLAGTLLGGLALKRKRALRRVF